MSGRAVTPCAYTDSVIVATTADTITPEWMSVVPSRVITMKTIDARPRGPNQPTYAVVCSRGRVPTSAIATGIIRTTVRLSTA